MLIFYPASRVVCVPFIALMRDGDTACRQLKWCTRNICDICMWKHALSYTAYLWLTSLTSGIGHNATLGRGSMPCVI